MMDNNLSIANRTGNTDANYCTYSESALEKNAKSTAFFLFALLGVILNIFIIILAIRFTVRKNLHHLIINMAVSDVLYLIVQLSIEVPALSNNFGIYAGDGFGVVICKSQMFLLHASFRVSLITLLVISIEWFRVTRRTLQRSRSYTLKQRTSVLAICWLIPMIVAAFYAHGTVPSGDGRICTSMPLHQIHTGAQFIFAVVACIPFAIAFFVISILSFLTTRRLSNNQEMIQAHLSEEQQNMRMRQTKAAVRMVLVSELLYSICWAPFVANLIRSGGMYSIRSFQSYQCIGRLYPNFRFMVHSFLPVINSCLSPCIYIIFLSDFREAAKKVLCRRNIRNQVEDRRDSLELQQPE